MKGGVTSLLRHHFPLNFRPFRQFATFPSNVYISASNNVRCDTLWKQYAQQTLASSQLINPSDAVLLFYSFAKIGFKDSKVIKALSLVILKNVHTLSPCGLSLILNSLKKLEYKNRDLLEIVTNQICLVFDKCSNQDISLVANSIAYFHVYHLTFWNKLNCYLKYNNTLNHLEASLILMAYARLDIRDSSSIHSLIDILKPHFEEIEIKNSTLILHSLAKLDIIDKEMFNVGYKHLYNILKSDPEKFDLQSLVLTLYTATCFEKSENELLEGIIPYKERLGNYRMGKLKTVLDALTLIHKDVYDSLQPEHKMFLDFINEAPLKPVDQRSRWGNDVSKTLHFMNIAHEKNVHIQELYADILFKDKNVMSNDIGPYNYYAQSRKMNSFAKLNIKLLELKGYTVIILPYYEWSELRTLEEKVERLYRLGRDAHQIIEIQNR